MYFTIHQGKDITITRTFKLRLILLREINNGSVLGCLSSPHKILPIKTNSKQILILYVLVTESTYWCNNFNDHGISSYQSIIYLCKSLQNLWI